jgi:hypothetical protein
MRLPSHNGRTARRQGTPVTSEVSTPFDSLESAHEYLGLLREALDEAYGSVLDNTAAAQQITLIRCVVVSLLISSSKDYVKYSWPVNTLNPCHLNICRR